MRRKKKDDHENHERWLVSYADFITLLFAFFVVMYSISSVNEGKYRVLSRTMVEAFNHNPSGLNLLDPADRINSDVLNVNTQPTKSEEGYTLQDEKLREVANDIRKVMEPLMEKDQVRVTQTGSGVKIDINAGVLFETGQALVEKKSADILKSVARRLVFISNKVIIEGHTDSTPIKTTSYPSNWELSSARASSVARLFIEGGINPGRISVMGFADQKPVETNETEEGRARNRRVTVNIESDVKG